jgi:dienelactone hydrolase
MTFERQTSAFNGCVALALAALLACTEMPAPQAPAAAPSAAPAPAQPEPVPSAGAVSRAPTEPAAPRAASPPASSDEAAERFFKALAAGDFAAARAGFDAHLQQALSKDQLAAAWASQANALGAFQSMEIMRRATQGDVDLRAVRARFARGELQGMLALHAGSHQIAGVQFAALPKEAAPAAYVDPASFKTEELKVGSAPDLLSGTLTLPVAPGRHPGLVLVQGSGPSDRDETVAANKPFKDLAEGLASRGIAVLRYDKRTFEYGNKLPASLTVDEEVLLDAIAAVHSLRQRPEVDPARLFVLGHSLGAQLAPEIAVRAKPVAGVVMLAPAGRPPWDVVVEQLRYLGAPADKVAEAERQAKQLTAGQTQGADLLGVPAAYWRDLASHDGLAMAKRLHEPMLILRGERDYQVTDADIAVWRKGLAGAGGVQIEQLDGLNHLFIAGMGKPSPQEYSVPGHVDARVIERIVAFVSAPRALRH